jgi:O-antigen/teichoic acid export membrane protein|tara:strand:+ start:1219 stop:2376 length:1158 start_codon:yes stop_codon:yes gene_type:complete
MWKKINDLISRTKDISTIGIVDVTSSGIGALFWFYIASVLLPEEYGEISYVIAIAAIVSTISMPGIKNALTVYGAKQVKIQSTLYLISLVLVTISSIVVFILFSKYEISLLIVGYVIFNLVISDLIGRKLFSSYAKYIIINKILMVILGIGLYYAIGNEGVIIGIALSSFPYILRIFKEFRITKIDFSLVKERIRFMLTSYVTQLSTTFAGSIDKLIIAPMLGFALLGNYHLGLQFISIFMIIPSIVFKYTLPHDASGNSNKKLKRLSIICSVVIATLGFFITPYVIPILFEKYFEAIEIIQILSISVIPSTINLNFKSKFLGQEKNKFILGGSMLYLPILIVGMIVLGNTLGAVGIAIAYNISVVSEMLFYVIMSKRVKEVNNV